MRKNLREFLLVAGALCVVQLARILLVTLGFSFLPHTDLWERALAMGGMLVIAGATVLASHRKKIPLSFFPHPFWKTYAILTTGFLAVIGVVPLITREPYAQGVFLLLCGSVVTPFYEELLFHGYVWYRFEATFRNTMQTWLASSLLYGLWQIGYVDLVALRTEEGLVSILIWRVIRGLGYGLALGAIRWKAKNAYAPMLLHGFLNIFAR